MGLIFDIKLNDTLPALSIIVGDGSNGFTSDPTGATVVFNMRKVKDDIAKITNGSGSIGSISTNTDGTYKATISYAWQGVDTDTLEEYWGEFKVTIGSDIISIPNEKKEWVLVRVVDDLS